MIKLLQIEWAKIKGYSAFWVFTALYFLLVILCIAAANLLIEFVRSTFSDVSVETGELSIFSLPTAWHTITWIASWWNIFLGLVIILLVSNEYRFKTMRQNLIDGQSRVELLLSKLTIMVVIAVFLTLLLGSIIFIVGNMFDVSVGAGMFDDIKYLLYFMLQAFAYMLFAAMFGFIIRNTALAFVLYLLYIFLIENLIAWIFLPRGITLYLPNKAISDMIPFPGAEAANEAFNYTQEGGQQLFMSADNGAIVVAIYCLIFGGILFAYIKKADL